MRTEHQSRTRSPRQRSLVIGGAVAVLAAHGLAEAGDPDALLMTRQTFGFSTSATPSGASFLVQPFEGEEGRYLLREVRVHVDLDIAADVAAENDADEPAPAMSVLLKGVMGVRLASFIPLQMLGDWFFTPGVAASDGVPGSGPDFWDFGVVETFAELDAGSSDALAEFEGDTPIEMLFDMASEYVVLGATPSTLFVDDFTASGTLEVMYLFEHACPGDADASGGVGFGDLLAVLEAWGACAGCVEDFDRDSAVDFLDLLTVLEHWGANCAAGG